MNNTNNQILIIEDDPALAASLEKGLQRQGFQTTVKSRGLDGLNHAKSHYPHLILLDIRLPDQSGFDTCQAMRKAGITQPIIMVTVEREEVDKILGLEMGADDYVTKPFSLRELVSRIRAQLRRAYGDFSSGQRELIHLDNLIIDQTRGVVLRGEETITLSPICFRLLVYLAKHRGQVLSRAQITEAVWGYDPINEGDRFVDVQIRRLRMKIEEDPGHPKWIQTVPGIGYRLSANE